MATHRDYGLLSTPVDTSTNDLGPALERLRAAAAGLFGRSGKASLVEETIADDELIGLAGKVMGNIESLKRDYTIDTSGTNYSEKRAIFDKLMSSKDSKENQKLLREAVALNMHLDVNAVHVRLPFDGKSERFATTSFRDYIGGLLERYVAK